MALQLLRQHIAVVVELAIIPPSGYVQNFRLDPYSLHYKALATSRSHMSVMKRTLFMA